VSIRDVMGPLLLRRFGVEKLLGGEVEVCMLRGENSVKVSCGAPAEVRACVTWRRYEQNPTSGDAECFERHVG